MDAYRVARLIEDIAATNSRLDKEVLVAELASIPLGKFVLKWAYDPFITFGLTAPEHGSANKFNVAFSEKLVLGLLTRLAKRELTGNAAEAEVAEVMQAFDADGARLLYLILSKDLKCGIGASTINGMVPGLIPTFSVMRANPFEAKKVKSWPVKGEFKLDGQRNAFVCRDNKGAFFTRSGKTVPALDFMIPIVMKAAQAAANQSKALYDVLTDKSGALSFMLDGEAMMGLFEETGALRRKGASATGAEYHLYDIMSFADFDAAGSVGKPLEQRRELLSEFVRHAKSVLTGEQRDAIQIVPQFFINNEEEAYAFFEKARSFTLAAYLARGHADRETQLLKTMIDKATGRPKVLEGAMLKDPSGLYDKKKSNGWLKMKAEETEDLRVTGWFEGKEGTKLEGKFGGWLVDREGVEVRVGGGFSDLEREEAFEAIKHTLAEDPVIERGAKKRYFSGGRLVEVEYHEVTPDGSLRHPRFVRYRDDKDGEVETKEVA